MLIITVIEKFDVMFVVMVELLIGVFEEEEEFVSVVFEDVLL